MTTNDGGFTTHVLIRTNATGIAGVFTCIQCGKEGLPAGAARLHCDNPRNLSTAEAFKEILDPESRQ